MNQSSVQKNRYCYSWHEANIRGLQVRNQNRPIKVKSETLPLLKIHMDHQMCNPSLIKSICTTKMWNNGTTKTQYAPPARN